MQVLDREARGAAPSKLRRRFYNSNTNFAKQKPRVDYEAEKIYGYSVMTMGEALGHDMWADETTLQQIVDLGNTYPNGIKMRFTHPGISSDGMGKQVARATNFRLKKTQVLADMAFIEGAHQSPQGDLVDYLLVMADKDPDMFGTSVVISLDIEAMEEFEDDHRDEEGDFRSPDKKNRMNYPHIRVAELHASDVVDSPALNPGGFFSQDAELPAKAEKFLDFLFNDGPAPVETLGDIHPDRVKSFVENYLHRKGLDNRESDAYSDSVDYPEEKGKDMTKENTSGAQTGGETGKEQQPPAFHSKDITLEFLKRERPELVTELEESAKKAGFSEGLKKGKGDCVEILQQLSEFDFGSDLANTMFGKVAEQMGSDENPEKSIMKLCVDFTKELSKGSPRVPASKSSEESGAETTEHSKKDASVGRYEARDKLAKELQKEEKISYKEAMKRVVASERN